MGRLLYELEKLQNESWVVGDAKIELQDMIAQVTDLQQIPATQAVLRKHVLPRRTCMRKQPKGDLRQDR